jgi:hypothetical protein
MKFEFKIQVQYVFWMVVLKIRAFAKLQAVPPGLFYPRNSPEIPWPNPAPIKVLISLHWIPFAVHKLFYW